MGPCAPWGEKRGESKGARSTGCRGMPCAFGGVQTGPAACELPCSQRQESAAAGTERHL